MGIAGGGGGGGGGGGEGGGGRCKKCPARLNGGRVGER